MASPNQTFGASIVPTEQRESQRPVPHLDSPSITPAASHEDLRAPQTPAQHSSPAPMYNLSPSTLLTPIHTNQNHISSRTNLAMNEKDLEAGPTTPLSLSQTHSQSPSHPGEEDHPFTSKVGVDINKECKMWPSKQTLLQERMAEKKKKREGKCCGACGPARDCWARFDKRQKLIIKIVMLLLILGIVAAIAVGITIAVHGGVYVSANQTQSIPNPNKRR